MLDTNRIIQRYKLDSRFAKEIDKGILISMLLLIIFGILNIYLCTKGEVFPVLGPFYFAKRQIMWFVISMVALYIILTVDYRVIYNYIPIIYWGSVILLLMVWIPKVGVEVNGARGWIDLKICMFQPSEIAKYGIILMVAKLLDEMDYKINDIRNLLRLGFYIAIPVFFILLQKYMGMTMVCFFIVLGMFFIAGLDKRVILGGLSVLAIGIIFVWYSGLLGGYRAGRINSFLNPEEYADDLSYQYTQGVIGIGAGGLTGIDKSFDPDIDPGYAGTNVPEIQTDFIFSAIAEQWGFIGGAFVLILYGVLITKMIVISRNCGDRFASIVCVGIISYFMFAVTQNIGMTIGLLPITGITLPLISYGGSSLLTTVIGVAMVLNISMRKKKILF
nr:FtsW/RodA/SpoVE family cell cycle protein [Clostridium paraputrificum]